MEWDASYDRKRLKRAVCDRVGELLSSSRTSENLKEVEGGFAGQLADVAKQLHAGRRPCKSSFFVLGIVHVRTAFARCSAPSQR